jgi:hypothetical protein
MNPLPAYATPGLAFDIVAGLLDEKKVCTLHGITSEKLRAVVKHHEFAMMVVAAKREWDAPTNAERRLRLKAMLAAEASLGDVYDIARGTGNAPDQLAAYKLLIGSADLSMGGRSSAGPGSGGDGITINIRLAGSVKPRVLEMGKAVEVAELEAWSEDE